jgi:hypothetical protein
MFNILQAQIQPNKKGRLMAELEGTYRRILKKGCSIYRIRELNTEFLIKILYGMRINVCIVGPVLLSVHQGH